MFGYVLYWYRLLFMCLWILLLDRCVGWCCMLLVVVFLVLVVNLLSSVVVE